jgi:cytochrome b6
MRYISLKRFGVLFMLVVSVGLFIAITSHAQASSPLTENTSNTGASPDWALAEAVSASPQTALTPPPATQDTCLSCHILGQNKGIWTPLARWLLFGGLGLVFVLGVYRSANTWVTRSPSKSITNQAVGWVDDRYQVSEPLTKVLKKPVPKYALRWFYCLGGITAFLFVVQGITGILLAFYYKPTPEAAYASIVYIETQVFFGSAIRAIHHWCANGMIVICIAHMLRVFIMGAYKRPRELNWVSGVLLLVLTLVFGFTGYLLPWDQRAFWATTVGSEIAGAIPAIGNLALVMLRVGWNVTGETLSRFYGLHVIVVPLATVTFMFAHFLMIRRQGIAKPL